MVWLVRTLVLSALTLGAIIGVGSTRQPPFISGFLGFVIGLFFIWVASLIGNVCKWISGKYPVGAKWIGIALYFIGIAIGVLALGLGAFLLYEGDPFTYVLNRTLIPAIIYGSAGWGLYHTLSSKQLVARSQGGTRPDSPNSSKPILEIGSSSLPMEAGTAQLHVQVSKKRWRFIRWLLRFVLIAASIGAAGLLAYLTIKDSFRDVPWFVYGWFLGCILNAGYLITEDLTPNKLRQKSRILRLFELWLDAKETELKKRINSQSSDSN
jgi:hypothetical protein